MTKLISKISDLKEQIFANRVNGKINSYKLDLKGRRKKNRKRFKK